MPAYSLRAFLLYFLRLGAVGFGGPIALAAHMRRDLVEQRGWITVKDYDEGLALAQLAPGPLAAQLAIYLGWVKRGAVGAVLVSLAFVMPSFVMVLALSAVYVRYGGLPWMQGAFHGVGGAVLAIIGRSAFGLLQKTLKKDVFLWSVGLATAIVTAITGAEPIVLVVFAGLVAIWVRAPSRPDGGASLPSILLPLPAFLITGTGDPAGGHTLLQVLGYFASAGLFVFGSGLAIVPFLHGGVVERYGWLDERQFLDAVAVAMITPGPVVITVAFIGYLVAGPLGGTLAAIGVFVPCLLVVIIAAPLYRKHAGKGRIKDFVAGVTAGAVGSIAGAVFVVARRGVIHDGELDLTTIVIALVTLALLARVKKLPEPLLIVLAGIVGVVLQRIRA
jgi:chromate transporter